MFFEVELRFAVIHFLKKFELRSEMKKNISYAGADLEGARRVSFELPFSTPATR